MRIRRRPQPAASDLAASTAPQIPPPNAARNRGWLLAGEGEGEDEDREARVLRASADLARESGASRRLALPQDDNAAAVPVVDRGGRSMSMSMSMGAPRGAADVGRMRRISAVNGDGGGYGYDPAAVKVKADAEARRETSNGSVRPAAPAPPVAVAAAAKDEGRKQQQQQQAKKRRGPAVLLEGSRCSRVNGRGWRCSQPTLVGYSLCEHHLGKGRTRTAAGAALARGAGGVGRLGRTEHGAAVAAAAATAPPLPKAEGPSLPGC